MLAESARSCELGFPRLRLAGSPPDPGCVRVWIEGEGEGNSSCGDGGMGGSELSGALTIDEAAVDSGEAVGHPR